MAEDDGVGAVRHQRTSEGRGVEYAHGDDDDDTDAGAAAAAAVVTRRS
jgi:hypothetical protein